MAFSTPLSPLLLLLLLPLLPSLSAADPTRSDTDHLSRFRYGADAHGILATNWSGLDACAGKWRGVSCSAGRVTSLYLPYLDLRGCLDPLANLDQLRLLDLHGNRLNGTLLPLLSSLSKLKILYLSGNDISGEIPAAIGGLTRLVRLDLSDNNFDGGIPAEAFGNLTRLLTLRLQNNLFSGLLPDLATALPRLVQLDVSNNRLSGRVPPGVWVKFGLAALGGNAGLCGPTPPLPLCPFIPRDSSPISSSPSSQSSVPSSPSSAPRFPATGDSGAASKDESRDRKGLSTGAIVGIALGNITFFFLLLFFLSAYCCYAGVEKDGKVDAENEQGEGGSRSNAITFFKDDEENNNTRNKKRKNAGRNSGESDDGSAAEMQSHLVFFDGTEGDDESGNSRNTARTMIGNTKEKKKNKRGKRFELDELLRASAEMLGKGSIGTVYRAVLEDGNMVAVKRLKDANPCSRHDFNKYMGLIGRLSHPNIVPLRAYYYARQEKLLIYDYLPNGTLFSILHGNRGTGSAPLDWKMRVSLILGAARGLACIHWQYKSSKIPHGNIKSSNVLLDKNGAACISDFGLSLLLNPAQATTRLGGYAAPEYAKSCRLSQEADVYAFGVLLLEVLTGKTPNQWSGSGPSTSKNPIESNISDGGSLPEWVKSVVREEWTAEVFDPELLRHRNTEEEMVAMLHLALACVAPKPENRPTMSEVVRMIQDIRVEQWPISGEDVDELNESHSISLSPSLPTTVAEDDHPNCTLTE